jgi:hypothetical protein
MAINTVKIYNRRETILDVMGVSQKAIWYDKTFGYFATGDEEDLPAKVNADALFECDWVEISFRELCELPADLIWG